MTALAVIVEASARVAATSSRRAKTTLLAACLRQLQPDEIEPAVAFLSGETRQGKLGVGYALLAAARPGTSAPAPSLSVGDVDTLLTRLVTLRGKGSAAERQAQLHALLGRATADEQHFLARLLLGELRQGALEGVMIEAVAEAAAVAPSLVRRAVMTGGGIARIAHAAITRGTAGLAEYGLRLMHPVLPMLAQPAEDVADALDRLGDAAFEWKLDGARIQVHRDGDEVRVYTRNLNDVTPRVPEIVTAMSALPARQFILDGEAIALRPDGTPHPFQVTMSRFGTRRDVAAMRDALPLSAILFDVLLADGEDLTARTTAERHEALAASVPARHRVPRIVTAARDEAEAFFTDALAKGHEGAMAKALDAAYEAGARGAGWLKVKAAKTLDLVVLAAEWGSGRRQGWLSNLHLGARDPAGGAFVMLGKTFKGMTDALLVWQTDALLAREIGREGHVVHVRPELVVEIAFNDLQASREYPGGLALRFARVKRYRPDKTADEADTIDTVRALYARQGARTEA